MPEPVKGRVLSLPEDVAAKVKPGHAFEADHPGHSAAGRWTCKTCGDAVLNYRGNIYGGATERSCEESQAFWARWRT